MNPSASLPFPAPGGVASGAEADKAPPSGELVTVTRLFNSLEAEMLRGCLKAEGIPATLGDAQTIQTDALLTVALGGIRVMVPGPFAEAARSTVDAFEQGALAIDELPDDSPPAQPDTDPPVPAPALGLSTLTWLAVAVGVIAVVVF